MVFFFSNCALCRPQRRAVAADAGGGAGPLEAAAAGPTIPASVPHMLRSKSEARILQQTQQHELRLGSGKAPVGGRLSKSQSLPSGSLLEASRRRLAAAAVAEAAAQAQQQLAADGTAAREFVQRYMQAIKDGNASWASAAEVSGLFTEDARMISADRQAFQGRQAIVRRLNQGVEQLARMAGDQPELPTFELTGPEPALSGGGAVVLRLAFKRGLHKMAFTMTFSMREGRIAQLHNSRG